MTKRLKYSVLLVSLLAFTTTTAVAAPTRESAAEASTENISEYCRFGTEVSFFLIIPNKVGAYAEYKFNPSIGIQGGIKCAADFFVVEKPEGHKDKSGTCTVGYISTPVVLRTYPFEGGKFCIFLGLQPDFLIDGNMILASNNEAKKPETNLGDAWNPSAGKNKSDSLAVAVDLKDKKNADSLNHFGIRVLLGLDYEFGNNITLGAEYSKTLRSVVKCKDTFLDFTGKVTLGYNFAPLFDK